MKEEKSCIECGAVFDINDMREIDGDYLCEDCFYDNYFVCEDCGSSCDINTETIVHGDRSEFSVCQNCQSHYFQCDDCREHYTLENMWDRINDICFDCSDHYYHCEDCGCLIYEDDVQWNNDYAYCRECYNDSRYLHDYSYNPDPIFLGECEDNLYLGVELEVDRRDDRNQCTELISKFTNDVYCKTDGSLDNGFEIVSHPATLDYHLNHLKWKEIMEKCRSYGFRSHDVRTCGIHIHVSRLFFGDYEDIQDLHIAKLILLINRFWDSHVVPFSRRSISALEQWSNKFELEKYASDTEYTLKTKMNEVKYSRGRYVAVNLQNENTIEFRIFKGTLKLETFFAILQFVKVLCYFAKNIDLDNIDTTEWKDIFGNTEYQELKQYNESKGLN